MKNCYTILSLSIILLLASCSDKPDTKKTSTGLWPPIEPYQTGYLKVSDVHEIYYECCGNPAGKPVFVLHGGPGGGCWPAMRQYFNPEKYFIVLHDQRGANRSRPFASIVDNTTVRLVEDIEALRNHLNIEKMMLLGGSWGSTLALAYAETHPERVTAMVLRGIWTSTQQEIDHFYHGGTSGIFPDAYDELLKSLPDPGRRPLPSYLLELLQSENPKQRKKISDAWLKYEWHISEVNANVSEIDAWLAANDSYAFSLIENYYMANQCFLTEGQLWQNLDKIKHIRSIIINGRFDMPCNLATAYRLHQAWPNSRLVIVEMAGHGGQAIMDAEANATREFED